MANIDTSKAVNEKKNGGKKTDWKDEPRTPVEGRPYSHLPVNEVKARAAEIQARRQEAIDAVAKADQEWRDYADELGAVSFSRQKSESSPLAEVDIGGVKYFPKRLRKQPNEPEGARQRYELCRRSGGGEVL